MDLDSKRDLASKRDFGFERGRALPRPRLGSARLGSARHSKKDVDSIRDVNSMILIFLKNYLLRGFYHQGLWIRKRDFGFEKGL